MLPLPPPTEAAKALAKFAEPPPTDAPPPLAVFPLPPQTTAASDMGTVALIGRADPKPARLSLPPVTEAKGPVIALASPATSPPKLVYVWPAPTMRLCEPVFSLPFIIGNWQVCGGLEGA